jgi:hypothetical protein
MTSVMYALLSYVIWNIYFFLWRGTYEWWCAVRTYGGDNVIKIIRIYYYTYLTDPHPTHIHTYTYILVHLWAGIVWIMIGKEIYLYLCTQVCTLHCTVCIRHCITCMFIVQKQWFGTWKIHIQVKLVTVFKTLYLTLRGQDILLSHLCNMCGERMPNISRIFCMVG